MARSTWQEEYERKRLEFERSSVVPAGPAQDEQDGVPVLDDEPAPAAKAPLRYIEGDELMATKFPDQRWLVEQILPEGLALVYADPKLGKALALDTPVATPSGWTTQGRLRPGDRVFGADGNPKLVEAVTETFLDRPCFAVRFKSGEEIVADAEHEWLVRSRVPKSFYGTRTTADMAKRVSSREGNGAVRHLHSVRVASPLQMPDVDLPIDPYVLGAWLGDGTSREPMLTSADPEIIDNIRAAGVNAEARKSTNKGSAVYYKLGRGQGLASLMRKLNLRNNKHIPSAYLRASERQRRALLQGLMDTDGSVGKHGIELTLTCLPLAEGALELMRTLGMKPVMKEGRATLRGRDCGPRYRITAAASCDAPVFRLPRKASAVGLVGAKARSRNDSIVEIVPVESVPVRCIQVQGGLYLAGRSMTVTHNSWLAYALARAVESGGVFLDRYQATEAPVIYLDLEQTEARSQARYRKMLRSHETLSRRLRFYHEFPRLDADALGELGKACEDTGAGLVIVDVLQSIWPSAAARGAGGNAYHQEAAVMSQLRKFAQEYRLAMLLLHHNNNAGTASGTKAILSVPDVLWKMKRPDEDNPRKCELGVTGRAVADMKFQLEWHRESWSWRIETFDGVEEDRFPKGQTEVAW